MIILQVLLGVWVFQAFVGAVIAFVEKDPKFGQFNLPMSLLVFVWALVMPHEHLRIGYNRWIKK
jgi:hypothetical protein